MPPEDKSTERTRLLRTAKGKRPQYFSDPAIDKSLAIIISLVGEVAVLRDRLDTLELLVAQHGLFPQEAIDQYEPSAEEQQRRDERRAEYLERVLRIVQTSREENTEGRQMAPLDEIIEKFATEKF